MKRRSESKDYVVVDFTGVSSRNKVVKAANYRAQVEKVTKGISKPGNPKLDWIFVVSAGSEKGHRFQPYVTSLQTQALWNLRGVLEALGVEVPDGSLQIVYRELYGLELGLTIEHETYQKRIKERIVDLFPLEELEEVEGKGEGEVEEEVEEEEKPSEKFSEAEMKKMEKGEMPKDRIMTDEETIELQRREREAAELSKQVKEETGVPGEIKIVEEETEEEEEEEEDE